MNVEVCVVLNEHFGTADDVDGELVGQTGLEFRETLLFGLQRFVLAIESDAKFVRPSGQRTINVERFAGACDGERRSGKQLLVHEDGERCSANGRRDFNPKRCLDRKSVV